MKEFVELTCLANVPWRPPNALFPMATSMCTFFIKKIHLFLMLANLFKVSRLICHFIPPSFASIGKGGWGFLVKSIVGVIFE
jgi:hypothetical protein